MEIFLFFLTEYNKDVTDGGGNINLLVRIAL